MQVMARVRNVGVPSKKLRLIADSVRGKSVDQALNILRFLPSPSAKHVAKVVQSAAANAENNHQLTPSELRIAKILVDVGPTQRRFRARPRGRSTEILKRSSHITVVVEGEE